MDVLITVAQKAHTRYTNEICYLIEDAAKKRGTGIAKRSPNYIKEKILEGKAVIALHQNELAGFCYIETWSNEQYIANSGLIVAEKFRNLGLAKKIKKYAFKLSRSKYPNARLFGITTSLAVMKINSELGYQPVTFSELSEDDKFWKGCQSCPNYDILMRNQKKNCLCTGMMYDPNRQNSKKASRFNFTDWIKKNKNKLINRVLQTHE
jgi:hypothetical protein